MKKEDRQIVWKDDKGYCKGQKVFEIWDGGYYFHLYLVLPNYLACNLNSYLTWKEAACGAEQFLKRLQEAVK